MLSHKKYAKITDFLKDQPEKSQEHVLYQVIEALGLYNLFKPFIGGNGITFLIPSDKEHVNEIVALYNSDDVANLTRIEDIFKSLIITFYIGSIGEFNSKKDDISTKHGISLEVESAKGDMVKLKDGSTITPYPAFKSGKSNIAVYKLTGKLLPLTGPPAKHLYDKPMHKKPIGGGCDISKDIVKFTRHVECRYWQKSGEAKANGTVLTENVYLEVVASFIDFLQSSSDPIQQAEYNTVMSIIDTSPESNYYIIFRPYGNDRIVSQDTLNKYIKLCYNSVSVFKRVYNMSTTFASDRAAIRGAIEAKRTEILANTSKATIHNAIRRAYDELRMSNTINSVKVYSDDVHARIKNEKEWQDTLRFYLRRSLSEYWSQPQAKFEDFRDIVYYCVHERVPGLNVDKERITTDILDKIISDELHKTVFCDFVRSDYFLYIPFTEAELNAQPFDTNYNPSKMTPIHYATLEWNRLDHYTDSERKELINSYVKESLRKRLGNGRYDELIANYLK